MGGALVCTFVSVSRWWGFFCFLLKLVFALNVYDFCNGGDQIKVNFFKKEFRWVVSRKEN